MSTNSAPQFTREQRIELNILSTAFTPGDNEFFSNLVKYMENKENKVNVIQYMQSRLSPIVLKLSALNFLQYLKNIARVSELYNQLPSQNTYLQYAKDVYEMMLECNLVEDTNLLISEQLEATQPDPVDDNVTYYDPRDYALTPPPPGAIPRYLNPVLESEYQQNKLGGIPKYQNSIFEANYQKNRQNELDSILNAGSPEESLRLYKKNKHKSIEPFKKRRCTIL